MIAVLVALCAPRAANAQVGNPVKPYIVFIVDGSGSMDSSTGFGNPSCTIGDTRATHAKCAVQDIVNGYGDMVMALGRYRQITTNNNCSNCNGGITCSPCQPDGTNCTAEMASGDRFELLVPLVEQNQNAILEWVDSVCGTCNVDQSAQPELYNSGATPIAGTMKGVQRYFQGLPTPGVDTRVGMVSYVPPFWGGQGADPIRNDPLKNVFISPGEQCRPYVVIMLTDGDETCVPDFTTQTLPFVQNLLTTNVDGNNYRIEVKPIGLGKSPGDTEIEQIAHAGGAADGPGFEGFYAQNQEELSLAVAEIISESLRFEICNDDDDDCDLNIDEDFPAKGTQCDDGQPGICRDFGTRQCTADGTGVECIVTDDDGGVGVPEVCLDGIDQDCDARVDEGCGNCSVEVCDNVDNDCDGSVDEGVTRGCGTNVGVCNAGIETCVNGSFQNCTATGGSTESCNGLDDNCDGITDGIFRTCRQIAGNPGPPPTPGLWPCQDGLEICPNDGSGNFGPCVGEVGPINELCDLVDNDCDGTVDEGAGGSPCTGTCGIGVTECVNGTIVCSADATPTSELCDGFDNDCDGAIDEQAPDNGPCNPNGSLCEPGTFLCINSQYECVGGVAPVNESCDCQDNNCNGTIDEGGDSLCAAGARCVECQCAFPCEPGEFPCPQGKFCSPDNLCLNDPCFGIDCLPDENGDRTQCVDGACVRSCDVVTCSGNQVCRPSDGNCVADDCVNFPDKCSAAQVCAERTCVNNPCAGVSCDEGEYCTLGECVRSCADIVCPVGQTCDRGTCEVDRCIGVGCGPREFCDPASGQCVADPCADIDCLAGEVCDSEAGACVTDPCLGVVCPREEETCTSGSCFSEDGPRRGYVAPRGAGCSASGPGGGGWAFAMLLGLLVMVNVRRRRGDDA